MNGRAGEPESGGKSKGKMKNRKRTKKEAKGSPGASKWPRPEAPMFARTLSQFLTTVWHGSKAGKSRWWDGSWKNRPIPSRCWWPRCSPPDRDAVT